ncbi:MAG: hypothetical protein A2Y33_12325 [Spirochaetes bacterium GWF1_51_8]|nr:MAG: hypothetical protein A2Y33_12325 [Spirochaetes bacterium GWF1_51_8]
MLTLRNIEMLRAGPTNDGRYVTSKKVARIYRDTLMAMADGLKPKAKVGDSHENAEVSGVISEIRHIGDSLIGDILMSEDVFEKMKNGAIPDDRSIEVACGFTLSNGISLKQVITGIVFGVGLPAEHALAPLFESSHAGLFRQFAQSLASDTVKVELEVEEYARLKSGMEAVRPRSQEEPGTPAEGKVKDVFFESICGGDVFIPGLRERLETVYEGVRRLSGHDGAIECLREIFTSRAALHTAPSVPLLRLAGKGVVSGTNGAFDPTSH